MDRKSVRIYNRVKKQKTLNAYKVGLSQSDKGDMKYCLLFLVPKTNQIPKSSRIRIQT